MVIILTFGLFQRRGRTEASVEAAKVWNKYRELKERLLRLGRAAVAFSGGVDSLLLLVAARECGSRQAVAVTIDSCFYPRRELEAAVRLAAMTGLEHVIIRKDGFTDRRILQNHRERCYFCKGELFRELGEKMAATHGITCLLEGSNADDPARRRPGMRALAELGVLSPLRELGFTKDEIRFVLAAKGVPVWDKPPAACLATRIPCGRKITAAKLRMIETAEEYLLARGFRQVRVRHHGAVARIEVAPEEREAFCSPGTMDEVDTALQKIGFAFVALDLAGYGAERRRETSF
jgi:uncharacterized protein